MAATRLWRTRRPWARIYPVPKRSGFRCAKHRVECFRMTQPKSRSIPSYTLGRWPILPKAFSSSKRCGVHQKKSKQISPSDASGRSNSKSIRAYLLTVFYRLSWLHLLLNPCCSSAYHCSTGSSIRASIEYANAFVHEAIGRKVGVTKECFLCGSIWSNVFRQVLRISHVCHGSKNRGVNFINSKMPITQRLIHTHPNLCLLSSSLWRSTLATVSVHSTVEMDWLYVRLDVSRSHMI